MLMILHASCTSVIEGELDVVVRTIWFHKCVRVAVGILVKSFGHLFDTLLVHAAGPKLIAKEVSLIHTDIGTDRHRLSCQYHAGMMTGDVLVDRGCVLVLVEDTSEAAFVEMLAGAFDRLRFGLVCAIFVGAGFEEIN